MKYLKKSYPKDFSFISSKLTKKIFKEKGFKETKIIRDWKNVVGEETPEYERKTMDDGRDYILVDRRTFEEEYELA